MSNNDLYRFGWAIRNDKPIPADVYARLLAAGIDVAELENRFRDNSDQFNEKAA
jgi:hypothetical protein